MKNKLISRRILLCSLIFGLGVFVIEEGMFHARSTVWVILLAYGLIPFALVCRIFGIYNIGLVVGQWSTCALAANAVIVTIPFAVVAWAASLFKRKK